MKLTGTVTIGVAFGLAAYFLAFNDLMATLARQFPMIPGLTPWLRYTPNTVVVVIGYGLLLGAAFSIGLAVRIVRNRVNDLNDRLDRWAR